MTYTPQSWIVVEITSAHGQKIRKVLGTWGISQWRLNSGNQFEEEFPDRWEFSGYSGSLYVCYKDSYGMAGYIEGIYDNFQHDLKLMGGDIRIVEEYGV
jgi:hypothetical protein